MSMLIPSDRRRAGRVSLEPHAFELVDVSRPLLRRVAPRSRGKAGRVQPFASASMASGAGEGAGRRRHPLPPPVFTIASSLESPAPSLPPGVPQWRVSLGLLAAGATAGCAVEAALYPLDTIKTRLQAMRSGGGLRALVQAGGGRGLYAGLVGNLVGVAPASAIFMAVYEPVKQRVLKAVDADRAWLAPLAGGVAAGLASSVVRVPTEVVKTRMQTGEFSNALRALRTIAAREGRRGVFAGYSSFLLRDLPFDAIEFLTYEQLKKGYASAVLGGRRELNPAEHSVAGAIAGAVTGLATTPLDVLKTRMMIDGGRGQYAGVADCARQILRDEGPAALLRGWQPRVIWIGVGGSIFFTVLEAAKKLYAPKAAATGVLAGEPHPAPK
ncbi:hypothetical protein ACKKBG_A37030 [Auxenochlorella protothecoides x Auxenochlorella symbiontica]